MARPKTIASLMVSAVLVCGTAPGGTVEYDFHILPGQSGLNADISVGFGTAGTLIGNWDPTANPTGTRTKPGLFGPFGDDENVPVPVSLDAALSGSPNTTAGGGFRLGFDLAAGLLSMSGYSGDLLKSGPESLTAELTLQTDTFRTRNPTFFYLGGIPITLPFGQITLNSLTASQVGSAPGVLTPIEANRYAFVVAPLIELSGSIDAFGQSFDLPATPTSLPLQGEIVFSGDTATLTSVQPLDLSNTTPLDLTLPQTPLALPTFDPDSPANVLLDLAADELSASIAGTLSTVAFGEVVPEPATLTMLFLLGVLAARRSRTH
jgi:hypothetical protein